MSDETPRLKLAQLVSMQELNNVTWNEALAQLDALVDLYLLGQFVDTPPVGPADGDAYLIGGSPTGAWSGHAYKIAFFLDGAWRFAIPFNGLRAFVTTTNTIVIYQNGVWSDLNALISANEVSVASAATCDLGAANALFVQITGTTTITGFGSGTNKLRFVRFAQGLTLTHNGTSLILLGGANRTAAAGDVGLYASDGSGNWRERSYFYAGGGVRFAAGTAAAPGLWPVGDTDTGLFSPAANALGLATGGTERGRLTSDGDLWLNTTTELDATSYASTGKAQLQIKGTAVIGRAGQWPVRIHGDGWMSLEFPPQSAGGFGFNCYYNGTTTVYRMTDYAFKGSLDASGNFKELSAPSGTAGSAVSWVEARRVTATGHHLLMTAVDNGVLTVGGNVMPEADNTRNLGSASFRFAAAYVAQLVATAARITTSHTPSSASDTGTQGEIAWDANYLYVCTATNTWKRAALASW
jgi:hypothetical protein